MNASQIFDGIDHSLMALIMMYYVSESSSNWKATCQLGSAIRCVRMQAEPGVAGGAWVDCVCGGQLRLEQPQCSCMPSLHVQTVRKHFGAFPRTEFRSYASPLQAFVMIPEAQGSSYRQIMVVAVAMSVFSCRITLTGREL